MWMLPKVLELKDHRPVTSWSPLGRLSSPEEFGTDEEAASLNNNSIVRNKDIDFNRKEDIKKGKIVNNNLNAITSPGSGGKKKALGLSSGELDSEAEPQTSLSSAGDPHSPQFVTTATTAAMDALGPGMGGSAVQGIEDIVAMQKFATEPAPQTAVVGSIVVLPCRSVNMSLFEIIETKCVLINSIALNICQHHNSQTNDLKDSLVLIGIRLMSAQSDQQGRATAVDKGRVRARHL